MISMSERLTWQQIHEKYPDQWVGLADVYYKNNDGISVESAIVKYADKTKSELTELVLDGELISQSGQMTRKLLLPIMN